MMRYLTLLTALCLVLSITSCQKETSDTDDAGAFLEIQLVHQVNGQPLQLNTPLVNSFNETFTLTGYKYYVSNLQLLNPVKPFTVHDANYLVNEQNPDSKVLKAAIKADSYDAIVLMIGVDSAHQVRGAQSGSLDPVHGMFWDANSGYMSAMLEGSSVFSGAPGSVLKHQIGGFEGQNNALRYIKFTLPTTMTIGQGQTLKLTVNVELLRWFDGVYAMSIANNPVILAPGTDAMKVADNYIEQFSLSSVDVK